MNICHDLEMRHISKLYYVFLQAANKIVRAAAEVVVCLGTPL